MNFPNILSFFRLLLVPVFAIVYFAGFPNCQLWALGIFFFAGFTDILDGYIARKYNMVTRLGRIIDPLADKLMVFTALLCIAIDGKIHIIFPILFFLKEAYQAYGALKLMNKVSDVLPANFFGKAATTLFYLAIAVVIVFPDIPSVWPFIMLSSSLACSVWALITYIIKGKTLLKPDVKDI